MAGLGDAVSPGDHVALIWDTSSSMESLQDLVSQLQNKAGRDGKVSVENVERLLMSAHRGSSFDVVLLGVVPGSITIHSSDILAEAARILKPGGRVIIQEPVDIQAVDDARLRSPSRLSSALTLAGMTGITEMLQQSLTDDQTRRVKETHGYPGTDLATMRVRATKPNYEVGSSRQLSLPKRPVKGRPSIDAVAVRLWTLTANDMNDADVDLIDSDDLLDEDDLKKPPPPAQRADCGESADKKRKACKNCTCGLAEELEEKKSSAPQPSQSACGNCYLGDAFRCASCPYLGMPAFVPGEKVLLKDP